MTQEGTPPTRRVVRGTVAIALGTLIAMAGQLAFTTISSRMLPPAAFGAYGAALVSAGLISLIATGGLDQAAARMQETSRETLQRLLTVAWLWGLLGTLLMAGCAPLVAWVWQSPTSVPVVLLLALGMPLISAAGVLAGALRRMGHIVRMAVTTTLATLAGLIVGLAAVRATHQAWALAVPAIITSGISVLAWRQFLGLSWHLRRWERQDSEHLSYGLKTTGMSILRYIVNQLPTWSLSRLDGLAGLGQWNRATTLIFVPLEQLQRAGTTTLFPEMRPSGPGISNPRTLQALVGIFMTFSIPLAGYGAVLAPYVVLVLLGERWSQAASWAPLAAVVGALSFMSVPLGSALEALGRFRAMLWVWLVRSVAILAALTVAFWVGSGTIALVGLPLASGLGVISLLVTSHRLGLIQVGKMAGEFLAITALTGTLVLAVVAVGRWTGSTPMEVLLVGMGAAIVQAAIQCLLPRAFPSWHLLLNRAKSAF